MQLQVTEHENFNTSIVVIVQYVKILTAKALDLDHQFIDHVKKWITFLVECIIEGNILYSEDLGQNLKLDFPTFCLLCSAKSTYDSEI